MTTRDRRHKRRTIQNSDPGKILDLVMSLTDDVCSCLQVKINEYLTSECDAELVFQIIVNDERMEASIGAVGMSALHRKAKISLTPKLIDVMRTSVGTVDYFSNFNDDIKMHIGPHLKDTKKRVVMAPVPAKPFSLIVCVVAPKVQEDHVTVLIEECFMFCWPTLKKSISLEYEVSLKEKCQQLLRMARRLFTKVASLETLLKIAMDQAKQLTKAEHCSVLLIDIEKMELVETYSYSKMENKDNVDAIMERRFPMNIGITGKVLQTGSLINSKTPREHPSFDPSIDSHPGIDCKTLLCFPIREQTGIIGVGQLINKVGDPYFDGMDEEMALAFSIYCGVCIVHSVVYQKIQEAHIRNTLANELVMYHMKVSDAEVTRILECNGFHNHPHISSIHFNSRVLPPRELPCYVVRMFSDLNFDKKFNINSNKLVRFVLHVKKSYRDVPYHNWYHGFNVAQWAYAAVVGNKLIQNGYLSELQGLMYLIAGLVHDLDHRGTTNSFQIQGKTTLAALYSSEGSVMERHHLSQAMCILNTEGCDILQHLPRRDYDRALILLRDYILATDLANYFKNKNEYKTIAMDFQKGNLVHTAALQALLMNAADLGDQIKEWSCVKKTAASVLTEFFNQGDEEKSRGGLPAIIMDRDKCFIPDLEIEFIRNICLPLYEILGYILPRIQICLKILENHIERWSAARPIFAEVPILAGLSVLQSAELDNLIDNNIKEAEKLRLAELAQDEQVD